VSPLFGRRLIKADQKTGMFQLNLSGDDRAILKHLVPQIVELMADPDQPVVKRLFPPAYSDPTHHEQEDEYHRLMQEDLASHHREELQLLSDTADEQTLSEDQLMAWMRAINSIRLVLGTYLDVSEDDERSRPRSPEEAVYRWLTYLQGEVIEAMSGQN
jgi:hypothetical protein